MKQKLLSSVLLVVAILFSSSSVWAITYTIEDTWNYFPGYANTSVNGTDQYGTPGVGNMYVTIDDGKLKKVEIDVVGRLVWDTLFINTSSNWDPNDPDNYNGTGWDDWDYIVRATGTSDNETTGISGNYETEDALSPGIYEVANGYSYTVVNTSHGRKGHPNGIEASDLTLVTDSNFVSYNNSLLTYDFTSINATITLGEHPFFAYAPWCANDVTGGSPVPEPATIILMGLGLIGLAGTIRKKINK